ncbi:MAG: hypothetical protein ACLRMZ_05165 [Blautia marasmi]
MTKREELMKLRPDNHDMRLKYYELVLKSSSLENLPGFSLPKGYRYVYYREGDKKDWIAIETSAREFVLPMEGRLPGRNTMPGKKKSWKRECFCRDFGRRKSCHGHSIL